MIIAALYVQMMLHTSVLNIIYSGWLFLPVAFD